MMAISRAVTYVGAAAKMRTNFGAVARFGATAGRGSALGTRAFALTPRGCQPLSSLATRELEKFRQSKAGGDRSFTTSTLHSQEKLELKGEKLEEKLEKLEEKLEKLEVKRDKAHAAAANSAATANDKEYEEEKEKAATAQIVSTTAQIVSTTALVNAITEKMTGDIQGIGHPARAFDAATFPGAFASQNPRLPESGHPLIGMDSVVSNVINNIQKHCVRQRTIERVPPVMITSMARSGKTTLLIEVYRALVADTKFEAILVTFNGQSGFKLRVGESPTVGFCRGLHEQLMGVENHLAPSVDALKDYLAKCTKPLVLLVDELNSLTPEVGPELASLLREEFLDRPNRYLVFTCHHLMTLSEALGSRTGTEDSPRPSVPIGVPTSLVIAEYNAIFGDARKISRVEIALWGGLCGLAWSIAGGDFQAKPYFNERLLHCPPDNLPADPDTHSAFVKQICSGARHPKMTRYQRYTYLPSTHLSKEGCPIWPLCYIAAFLQFAGHPMLSNFIARMTSEASNNVEQESGIEWQAIVLAAVAIRIHSASIGDLTADVTMVVGQVQKDTQFMIVQLPYEVVDVAGAEAYVRSRVTVESHLVVLAFASHSQFKIFDGLIIHFDEGDITVRHGLQSKQGKAGAGSDVPEGWSGFLFGGRAPQRTRPGKVSGWVNMDEDQVTDFLPVSLRGLLPAMWPSGK